MSEPKTPDVWLEIAIEPYPSGATETTRISTRPMVKPNRIEGRVRPGSWNVSERALSDWKGQPEASTLSVEVNDVDGAFRAISETLGVSKFSRAETTLKLLSEAGRAANLAPRVIHRGVLAKAPTPLPGRMARVEIVDRLGSQWYALDPAAPLQKQFVSREQLEAGGIVNTPKDSIRKPYPIILGEHSDHGALDVNGNSAEKGLLPVLDLGDMILTETGLVDTVNTNIENIPPPVLSAVVVGTPGSRVTRHAVSMITATGETIGSNLVELTDAPDVLDVNNYVRLTWVPPAGWEDVYAAQAIAYRVCGRSAADPNRYLDIMNNGGTFVNPETEYHDGEQNGHTDFDSEKEPGPPAVGTATVVTTIPGDPQSVTTSTVWGVLCWALGYSELDDIFGSNVADGAAPGRTMLDPDDPDLMTPLSANWPNADPWVTINGLRLSVFYVKGVRLQQHREGSVSFAVNACGMTDTGDDTGTPITEASAGFAWILNQLALKEAWDGTTCWPLETYSDGTEILDTAALDAFQALTVARIGGRGYQFHLALHETTTVGQFYVWFNTTFNCYSGQNDDGQYAAWAIDDAADPAAAPIYRQRKEIAGPLPAPMIAEEELENRILFHYDWDPDAQAWRGDVEKVEDALSQSLNGVRDAVKNGGFLELRCTRDRATARDAMARRLFHNKVAPIYQPIPVGRLNGLEQGMGTLLRLTHEDGLGVAGYVNRPFFVVRKGLQLNGPNQQVVLTARDVYRVYNLGAGVLSDEGSSSQLPFVMQ